MGRRLKSRPVSNAWRRLALWPRLAISMTVGFGALFGIFSVLALRAVHESTDRILEERLLMAQMSARTLDRALERGFSELERATEFAAFDPEASSLAAEKHLLAHTYARGGTFSLGVYLIDRRGRVAVSQPQGRLPPGADLSGDPHMGHVLRLRTRSVSRPFRDRKTGRPAVALTSPILNPGGTLRSTLVGLVDASGADIAQPLEQARELGRTGHAELVDDEGVVIASTTPGEILRLSEHLPFSLRMLRGGIPGVENVPFDPGVPVPADRRDERHVMAFAPLKAAPWGVTLGGLDVETFAPADRLRRALLLTGSLTLTALWLLTLLGARLLVRPVRTLTRAAQEMASGNLQEPVKVREGGEIGTLAESLDVMRVQLRASLAEVRRWGKELEVKVRERTAEIETRNRQLAAVAAVATAANQPRELEETLGRCLEVVLEHTAMEAGAVRLLDATSEERLGVPIVRGDAARLPCGGEHVGARTCLCGLAASTGATLYIDPSGRRRAELACRAPARHALAVLPLNTHGETLGVLFLAREGGDPPGEQERLTFAAVANQIAVAIENARLLGDLRQLEAQREMQRLRAELLSAVSHELRTPLGIIKGYATTLLHADAAVDPETQREFLQVIDDESGKLDRMIDDLLDVSRLHAGRLPVDRKPVAVGEFVERAATKSRPAFEEARRPLSLSLPREEVVVLADPMRVEQVLRNLLDNAARYSEPAAPVEVRVAAEDGYAVVSVSDRGDGIPEAEQQVIFEPFYRGEGALRSGGAGAGLGLAICRGIVEAHGGKIWVESAPAAGSTFLFTLPVLEGGTP